jgi:hypothetical protein
MSRDFPVMLSNSMASNPADYLQNNATHLFAKKYSESLVSNQDDVGKEQEVDEHGYPLKLGDFYVS